MSPISRGFTGRRRPLADASRLPPGQYLERGFPVLAAGPTPRTPLEEWSFAIDGAVDRDRASWSWEEFLALPGETPTVDIHCVTKWSKFDTAWKGVSVDTLLERPDDLDQHVLRGRVDLAQSIHPLAHAFGHVGQAAAQLAHHDVILESAALHAVKAAARGDRGALAIGEVADRHGALGYDVGQLAPGIDQLVKLFVQGAEQRAGDRPVELLADQGQVGQLDQRRLQLVAYLVALVLPEGGKMGLGG